MAPFATANVTMMKQLVFPSKPCDKARQVGDKTGKYYPCYPCAIDNLIGGRDPA